MPLFCFYKQAALLDLVITDFIIDLKDIEKLELTGNQGELKESKMTRNFQLACYQIKAE